MKRVLQYSVTLAWLLLAKPLQSDRIRTATSDARAAVQFMMGSIAAVISLPGPGQL
jgi:hypothetical protein